MFNQWNAILRQVSASTFEDLGFLLPDADLSRIQLDAPLQAAAQVRFKGPFEGCLIVALHGEILAPLAANMLGEDSHPSPELQKDALGEIANVICGNILPPIAGESAVFRLSSPVQPDSGCRQGAMELAAATALGLDEGRAEVSLYLKGKP